MTSKTKISGNFHASAAFSCALRLLRVIIWNSYWSSNALFAFFVPTGAGHIQALGAGGRGLLVIRLSVVARFISPPFPSPHILSSSLVQSFRLRNKDSHVP